MNKKILLFFILILSVISFTKVNAKVSDVSIKNVELLEINGTAEEVDNVRYSGMNINYNVIFKQLDDSVKYRVTIQNRGNEDIYINNKGEINNSNYVVYDYIWDDNKNVVKGNSEKTFTVSITYHKDVDASILSKGKYVEAKDFVIRISDQKGNVLPVKNPQTDSNLSMFIILLSIEILMVMAVTIYLIKNKKLNIKNIKQMKKANMISIGVFLILVLGTIIGYSYCLDAAQINVSLKVGISKARLARSCYSDSYISEHPNLYGPPEEGDGGDDNGNGGDESLSLHNTNGIETHDEEGEEPGDDEDDDGEEKPPEKTPYDYCIDWNYETWNFGRVPNSLQAPASTDIQTYANSERESIQLLNDGREYADLITTNSKKMERSYIWYNEKYNLLYTSDVSDLQNGEVILGVYESENSYNYLLIIGQDGGVLAPVDSSWLFGNTAYVYVEGPPEEGGEEEAENLVVHDSENDGDEEPGDEEDDDGEESGYIRNIGTNIMSIMYEMRLDKLDVSDTNNMSGMFAQNGAYQYNHEIYGMNTWNTSNVKDMSKMFYRLANKYVNSTVEGLSSFNTSKVENMEMMFKDVQASIDSNDMANWNTSNVKTMYAMFEGAFNNLTYLNISNWNVSNVVDMSDMFYNGLHNVKKFDVSNWNVSNVKYMYGLFSESLWNIETFDISKWNTSNVENMGWMFERALCSVKEFDISNWNVEKVKYVDGMFYYGLNNTTKLNLSNWNLSSVEDMSYMFNSAFSNADKIELYLNNIDFTKFDVSKDEWPVVYLFYNMPNQNVKVYVKNTANKEWLLNLNSKFRPTTWTENNIVVAS